MSLPSRPWHLLFFHWGKSTEITTRPGNTRHLKPYPSAPVSSLGGRRPRPVRFWNTNGAHKVDCESHGNWLGISFWWKKNIFQDFIRFQDLEIRLNKKKQPTWSYFWNTSSCLELTRILAANPRLRWVVSRFVEACGSFLRSWDGECNHIIRLMEEIRRTTWDVFSTLES